MPDLRIFTLLPDQDFRAKATFGVALAALALLLPFAALHYNRGDLITAFGTIYIVVLLAINVALVSSGRCHQRLTLYGLVPVGMFFMTTVFRHDAIIASFWCFPTIIACYCMLSRHRALIANLIILSIGLPMAFTYLPLEYSARVGAILTSVSVFSLILVSVIDQLTVRLQTQLLRDPLTGLLNRLSLKESLEAAVNQHRTHGQTCSLLAIDIDHFKSINDRFGHEKGDAALTQLSSILAENLRTGDLAFRTGGEEFMILLSTTGDRDACIIAERLRRSIEVADIIPEEAVTVSIGVAQHMLHESWQKWCKRADTHLYEAKLLGRNRVTLACKTSAKVVSILSYREMVGPDV